MSETFFFRPVIALWRTIAELAEDIGEEYVTVQQWHFRDSIPPQHYGAVAEAAKKRAGATESKKTAAGFRSVTIERLAGAARDRAAKRKQEAA